MIDFYELLGINRNASTEEIKQAYRKMVKKYHPDVNKDKEANKIIVSLNEAKEILLNVEKRLEYDKLLNDIEHSKQFSKNTTETYSSKTKEYKENYADFYLTKWQFFINYLKNAKDSIFKKYLKSIFVFMNYLFFLILKAICFGLVFVIYLASDLIDYLAGFVMLVAVLSLFITTGVNKLNYIPFIPTNIENFILFSLIAMLLETAKVFIIEKSYNLFAIIQNIEDKIFIFILSI